MISQSEILVLDNNKEYAVVSSIMLQNINYVYLVSMEDYKEFLICKYENNRLEEIVDKDLLKLLIAKFNKDLKENLSKIINE